MATILESAKKGVLTPPYAAVAELEHRDPQTLCHDVANGSVVLMHRGNHVVGIGRGLRTKINVNIGTSHSGSSMEEELRKAQLAETYGADTLSDLSMSGDIMKIRENIFRATKIPITTVPIYQTAAQVGLETMTTDDIIATIREQAQQGVSSMVLHCITPDILTQLARQERLMSMVSKGGAITSAFMQLHHAANPFIEHFDEILSILKTKDIVLSFGNTARSGCIKDAWDHAHTEEVRWNSSLARYAHDRDVQVIIEGAGGHRRFDRIAPEVRYYKQRSPFPLFVAGPLPTDIALGYDHIAACVGASAAAAAGADYLCAITPAEHLGLPSPDHVKEGLIACRIAAHIGDIIKIGMDASDQELSARRAVLDREGQITRAFDPEKARQLAGTQKECTMCGDFCAIKLMARYFGGNQT